MTSLRYPSVMGAFIFLLASPVLATPIQSLPDLQSISVFEQSGAVFQHVFGVTDPSILERRGSVLSSTNNDFTGTRGEYYDVFYSDADGTLNTLGRFLTIEARFDNPNDSALNINGVRLDFAGGGSEFADSVASFVALGTLAFPATVVNAVDGALNTTTLLGYTTAGVPDRLRLTVGLDSTSVGVPEPGALVLIGLGVAGLAAVRRRRRV